MFQTVVIKAIVFAVLEWLRSLWDRFVQKQKNIEQGRKEVVDALAQKKQESDKELEKLRNSNSSFDAAIDELRKRSNSSSELLHKN